MRRWMFFFLAVLPVTLSGCSKPEDAALAAPADGWAEIPEEILGELDESTQRALMGEPNYIALTFDDGPRRDTTSLLLNGLMERGAVATFFVIGQQVPGNEDLIRRMAVEGHQVGNHTYSHVQLLSVEKNVVVEEVQKTEVLLENILGERDYWLRPPYGMIDKPRAEMIHTPMIYWTLDPEDWKLLDSEKVVDRVVERASPGDIILMHDFYPTSVDAALEIVDRLHDQGYVFVTVEELFRIQETAARTGAMYASPRRLHPLR